MKALILAAGLGSRLGLDIPKPMYTILGKPILEHNILLLKKHNIENIYINLHHMPDVIKNYFGDGSKWNVNITYSFEENLLGTAGTVKNLTSFWDETPFFVLYGDNYTNINLTEMLELHKTTKPLATVALFDPKVSLNSGIAGGIITMDEDNNIHSFIEGKENGGKWYVNAGVYILESKILDLLPNGFPSDFGKDIFPKLLKDGILLKGYLTTGFVFAIDTKDALKTSEEVLNKERN